MSNVVGNLADEVIRAHGIKPSEFYEELNDPKNHDKLVRIINILFPKTDFQSIGSVSDPFISSRFEKRNLVG